MVLFYKRIDLEASVFSIKGGPPERWGPPQDARLLSNFYLWAVILSDYSAKIPSMVLCALAAASEGVLVPVMDSFTARERASEISGHWA